jgi:hypothetical protein
MHVKFSVIGCLSVRSDFLLRRNQARQHLATLPKIPFKDLASDVLFDLRRRYPEFEEPKVPGSISCSHSLPLTLCHRTPEIFLAMRCNRLKLRVPIQRRARGKFSSRKMDLYRLPDSPSLKSGTSPCFFRASSKSASLFPTQVDRLHDFTSLHGLGLPDGVLHKLLLLSRWPDKSSRQAPHGVGRLRRRLERLHGNTAGRHQGHETVREQRRAHSPE